MLGHSKSPLINGEHLTHPECVIIGSGWYDNPQQARLMPVQLQRLSEEDAMKRKRQSELHRNMQKSAEMTDSAKRVAKVIKKEHWEKNKSLRQIAKELGLTWGGLQWYLRTYNIQRRGRVESMNMVFDGHGPNWKGGRTIFRPAKKRSGYRGKSYVMLKRNGHPNANIRGYVYEHRYLMAEHIGRPIKANEIVHHKNGDTIDNRIANLEVRLRGGKDQPHGHLTVCPNCGHHLPV